jgi:methionyl-tRNA formyltransferase
LSDAGVNEAIAAAKPDFIIVAAFGQLLPRATLDIAPCINLHASLLPQYRGASPVQQSLLSGDAVTGVTSMRMEEGLDTGDILERVEFAIPPDMRLHALMDQLTEDAANLTLHTLRHFDALVPTPQNHAEATHCKKIKRADGQIDFADAQTIYDQYRAFEGWPGIFTAEGTKLDEVAMVEASKSHTPGTILALEGDVMVVGCAVGALKIGRLQPPSKKPMSAKAYCVGRGLRVGDSIV